MQLDVPPADDMEIKTMKLYTHLDRLTRQLDATTTPSQATEPLDVEALSALDCLHFFGDEPIRRVQELLKPHADTKRMLDVGTGFGGTARLLAHRTQCHVDAVELQPDLSALGAQLTQRCDLHQRVTHLTGDFLQMPWPENHYDGLTGLLCFMHIRHWRELFSQCFACLKPGGFLYVEDFFKGPREFTPEEDLLLQRDIFCADLLTKAEFLALWRDIGFEIEVFEDATTKWTPYVTTRAEKFDADIDLHIARNGKEAAMGLSQFYRSVATVFNMGNLGGYTLIARKPMQVA